MSAVRDYMAANPSRAERLREHGRREHVDRPRHDCPACRKFARGRTLALVPAMTEEGSRG